MVRAVESNLEMIRHVAKRLGELRDRVVFLGGAATALLITDTAIPDVRITNDVDVIVEIASRGEYYRLADSLNTVNPPPAKRRILTDVFRQPSMQI